MVCFHIITPKYTLRILYLENTLCNCWIFSLVTHFKYHIQPNYHTVRLGFSKMLGKLVVKYVPTYTLKKAYEGLIK